MSTLVRTFLSAVLAYSTHYSISKLYSEFCIPAGIYGFFQGGLTAGSPICSTALTFMANTHTAYSTIIFASLSRMIVDFALETSDIISKRVEEHIKSTSESHESKSSGESEEN